jgi:hypothetical protein
MGKQKMKWFFSILAMVLILVSISHAVQKETLMGVPLEVPGEVAFSKKEGPFKVKVVFDGSYDYKKENVLSYINKELIGLRDVEIVDEGYEWLLKIGHIDVNCECEPKHKSVLFVVLFRKDEIWPNHYPHYFKGTWGFTGQSKDLKEICESIVTRFDVEHLEKRRKLKKAWEKIKTAN